MSYSIIRTNSDNTTYSEYPKEMSLSKVLEILREQYEIYENCKWEIRWKNGDPYVITNRRQPESDEEKVRSVSWKDVEKIIRKLQDYE